MLPLSDILNKKRNKSPLLRSAEASLVVEQANKVLTQIFGEEFLNYARAIYLKQEILSIACLSSVAAQEVRISEENILKEINDFFGKNIVSKLKYIV